MLLVFSLLWLYLTIGQVSVYTTIGPLVYILYAVTRLPAVDYTKQDLLAVNFLVDD